MNYDFTGKSIKCDTWEQMLHLAKLAEEQGYREMYLAENGFNNGRIHFEVNSFFQYINLIQPEEDNVINYSMFIIPTETIEVNGCGDCPLYTKLSQHDYQYCSYPDKQQSCQMHVDMFATCPLKKSSITIKLKQNDTTGN